MMKVSSHSNGEFLLPLFLSVAAVAVASFFSFDLSDEGFNLLVSSADQPLGYALNYYARIIGYLNYVFPVGPFELRIIRLIVHLLTSLCFSIAFVRLLNFAGKETTRSLIGFVLLMSFTSYFIFPNSLTYNSLAYNIVQLSVAMMIFHFTDPARKLPYLFLRQAILALLPVILIYVKITSAILLFVLTLIALGITALIRSERRYFRLAPLFYLLSVALLIYLIEHQTFIVRFSEILQKARRFSAWSSSYDPIKLAVAFFRFTGYAVFAFVTGILASQFHRKSSKIRLAMVSMGIALLIWVTTSDILSHTIGMYFLAAVLMAFGFFFDRAKHADWRVAVYWFSASVFLFLATVTVFAGTNNSNFLACVPNSGLFIPTILFLLGKDRRSTYFIRFFPMGFTALLFTFLFIMPYGQPPVWTMSQRLEMPHGQSLLVDKELKSFVKTAQSSLDSMGYQKGDPIFAVYRMPGLVYLLEGYAPGGIIWRPEQNRAFFYYLSKDSTKICQPCFLIYVDESDADSFLLEIPVAVTSDTQEVGLGIRKLEGPLNP